MAKVVAADGTGTQLATAIGSVNETSEVHIYHPDKLFPCFRKY